MMPSLMDFYSKHRLESSAATVQSAVQEARVQALKQKVSYRLVIHDLSATEPNQVELQRMKSGSWSTVVDGTHSVAETIEILGANPYNSMDYVTVSKRGECSTGNIYLQSAEGDTEIVRVQPTCITDRL